MKNIVLFVISIFISQFLSAQMNPLDNISNYQLHNERYSVSTFTLRNGLTVILNEDRTQKDILGSMLVRGGSKYDEKGSSGTAHYLEHMMFKGTTTVGTVDYKKEKPYLDSISMLYELMRLDRGNEVFEKEILKKIDRLSVKASSYAIPNEFSRLISEMGGTQNNAFTTFENIVYYNKFPENSLKKWLELYRDRFQSPVFRLFQSELETVYEEKNMAMDNYFRRVYEEFNKSFYPNSIYGQSTVLGSVDDLKHPSLLSMELYHKYYYVSNNMALVLIGDFNTMDIIPLIEKIFNSLRKGDEHEAIQFHEDSFKGREVVKKRLTPIPVGILGYRGVNTSNKDEIVLKVLVNMLTNESNTGLIDTLVIENELLEAQVMMDNHYDEGGVFIFFIPKLIGQSFSNAEKKILAQIDLLKANKFDNKLLHASKNTLMKDFSYKMENSSSRLSKIIDIYMTNHNWEGLDAYNENIKKITRADIVRVANKYFGDDYLFFQSKMGLKKSKKIDKLNQSPLNLNNSNAVSQGAKRINSIESEPIEPNFIDFASDVLAADIRTNLHFYYVNNPLNNVFTLKIRIGYGELKNNKIKQLAYYLNNTGTKNESFSEFSSSLQLMGSSITFDTDNHYFTISLDGFDGKLDSTFIKLNELLYGFAENETLNKKMVQNNKIELKLLKKNISSKSKILEEYALYGEKSVYKNRLTNKEISNITYDELKTLLKKILLYETYVHYVGQSGVSNASSSIEEYLPKTLGSLKSQSYIFRPLPVLTHNMIYFLKDKNSTQSHIRYNIPSRALSEEERGVLKPFNMYFGLGMNSVIFREIRENRSLAYSAYGYYSVPYMFSQKGLLKVVMSTQSDKTNEAVDVVDSLVNKLTIERGVVASLKTSLINSFNSELPDFRYKSYVVQYWTMQGYKYDPRINYYNNYLNLNKDYIYGFYTMNVQSRKYILSIVGNSKRFDLKKIKKNAEFKKLKIKDILR